MNSWVKQAVTAAAIATTVSTAVPALAAADLFIKIGEIKGDSVDAKHKGEIDALTWSWGTSQSTRAAAGGAAAGRAIPQDLIITKAIDSSSPLFVQFATTGKHFAEVQLTVRIAGKSNNDFIRIKLKDVMISSMKLAGAGGQDLPTEEIALTFQVIEFTVAPPSGSPPITTTYNYATNR